MYELQKIIIENKRNFDFLLKNITNKNNLQLNINIAQHALTYAVNNHCGIFYSRKLENFYTELGESINIDLSDSITENSCLHVMTECYLYGGHTRVVEHWIEMSSPEQKHSVVLLKQKSDISERLKENIQKKNGNLYIFEETDNQIDKAIKLRQIATSYEYVILHTHMDDPIATVAFSHKNFKRPVIFFNHADHSFWIGKNVSDVIADINFNRSITETKRNITNRRKLPIPLGRHIWPNMTNKKRLRKKLGVSEEKKVIVTSGNSFKYNPIMGDKSYFELLDGILGCIDDVHVFVIGPDKNEQNWQELKYKYSERLEILGIIPYNEEYTDYLSIADLFLDSYPMNGYTACLDAIALGLPFISLDRPWLGGDFIAESGGCVKSVGKALELIKKLLSNEEERQSLLSAERTLFEHNHIPEKWLCYLKEVLGDASKHIVKKCMETEPFFMDIQSNILVTNKNNFVFFKDKYGICIDEKNYMFFLKKRKYICNKGVTRMLSLGKFSIPYKTIKL